MRTSNNPQFNHYYELHCKHLKLKGLQPKTIEAYTRALRRIGDYFDFQVDNLNQEQLLDYFHALLERLSWSAVKLDLYGLKFFYTHVLKKPWTDVQLIKPPRTKRIPDIISVDEVRTLVMATDKLSYRVFFFTLYSMGLRLGEGLRLQIGDIDATRQRVHIRNAKGNKDRLVPLPDKTLRILRRFWSLHRHPQFLFPSRKRGLKNAHLTSMPLGRAGVQVAMTAVVRDMGLKKRSPATRLDTAMPLTC
jgi:integrase/recombinase XerD